MYILGCIHFCFHYSHIIPLIFKGCTVDVSVKRRYFFPSLLHFEIWTLVGVEWCPRAMVKLGYEWRAWRRTYCRMQGTDSPSGSFCCGNIAKLPFFLWISIHPCPRPISCPQESWRLLHVTRGSWLPFPANERFPLQISLAKMFRFTQCQKKIISPNVSTDHHQNHR